MSMIANVLALALIVADEPPASPAPPAGATALPKASKPRSDGDLVPLELWDLTLREAIRIGLDNSEVVRVISLGAQSIPVGGFEPMPTPLTDPADRSDITIAPIDRDASVWKFQADVMAHVRSIEQQYWALWSLQAALRAREDAVKEGEEILRRERADLEVHHGDAVDVAEAEAEQHLEKFKLDLVGATSDLITTERQLRNILGLPLDDNRRIIAASPPIEARVEPAWETCLREMQGSQPDLVQQAAIARSAELLLILARNQLLPPLSPDERPQFEELDRASLGVDVPAILGRPAPRPDPAPDGQDAARAEFSSFSSGVPFSMPIGSRLPLANTRQAQYQLLRQRSALQQITHQATHSLARFFLEIDANHEQFRAARRLNLAARRRLEAQRVFYEEGRVTVDRLLDAVGQQAGAIAQEAQYRADYNTAIAALEEAKGTLLAYDGIAIADRPSPRKAYVRAKDQRVAPASFEKPAEASEPLPAPAPPAPGGKTFKLKARLVPGGLDLDIEVREGPASATVDQGH